MRSIVESSIRLVPWRVRGVIKSIPVLAPLQRWIIDRFLNGYEFTHVVDAGPGRGLKCVLLMPEDKGVWTGTYELRFAGRLAGAVKAGDVCLDIGGWRGFLSGVLGLAGAARVFIFEPLPENAAHIRQFISLNPSLPLELIEVAISDSNGTAEFRVMSSTSMGKLASSHFQEEEPETRRISVQTITLDRWLESSSATVPTIVKIDVEGVELSVLRGAEMLLEKHHPRIFIEAHTPDLAMQCHQMLAPKGYEVRVIETGAEPDGVTGPKVTHLDCQYRGAVPKNTP